MVQVCVVPLQPTEESPSSFSLFLFLESRRYWQRKGMPLGSEKKWGNGHVHSFQQIFLECLLCTRPCFRQNLHPHR